MPPDSTISIASRALFGYVDGGWTGKSLLQCCGGARKPAKSRRSIPPLRGMTMIEGWTDIEGWGGHIEGWGGLKGDGGSGFIDGGTQV